MTSFCRTVSLALVSLSGCRMFSPLPDMRTLTDHAHEIEPRCKTEPARSLEETLPRASIDSVRPAYSYVHSGPVDPDARLRGASIHIRPGPAMSKESLGRALECHQVAATLGQLPALEGDPTLLPDRWVDVDVESDRDGFVVLLRTDEFDSAQRVLARAKLSFTPPTTPAAASR